MSLRKINRRSPWCWIPTLYFAEGIPYVAVMTIAVILYKRMGVSNTEIALYTSWLYLPWVLKPLWSPFVDILKTRRWWIIMMQLLVGAGLAGIAFTIPASFFLQVTLAFFWLLAFSSATHDIAADGFYMIALTPHEQSLYVGIRSTFYRIAMITGQGLLIILTGWLEIVSGYSPVEFKVMNSPIPENERFITSQKDFVLSSSTLYIAPGTISVDSVQNVVSRVNNYNRQQGFVPAEEVTMSPNKAKRLVTESWWENYVSRPLGNFIRKHFGDEENAKTGNSVVSGNVGIISVKPVKIPEPDREIMLNTHLRRGDNSFQLIAGERLVFTHLNGDKPAYMVIRADAMLTGKSEALFRGLSGNIPFAWSITFFVLAGMFLFLSGYHRWVLPRPSGDIQGNFRTVKEVFREFWRTFVSFFRKKEIGIGILFMLTYRLAESQLLKLASPFMLDDRDAGGLGLTTGEVGMVYGTVGVIALTIGGILGGIAASRKGLHFWLWPMALAISLPNLVYVYLSYMQPESLLWINIAVAVEQFGYGFGFTAYMLYMIYISEGEHKTAHYAICTAFMALGMMIPGMAAGWIEELIGYNHFFIWVMICTLPGFAVLPFLKIDRTFGINEDTDEKS